MTEALMFVTLLIVAFILANVGARYLFLYASRRVTTPEERQRNDYMARFEGNLAPYRERWFGLQQGDWSNFAREYSAHELNIYAYDPFCEYKHPPRTGNFINYSPHGFRHGKSQGPWPPHEDDFVVFFFGGSTTLAVGPDWTSVPSHLQALLDAYKIQGRSVKVYNFGRGAYFSSLETALFNNLLRDGHRCDLAIFMDGINDPYFTKGIPSTAGVYQAAIAEMNESIAAETRSARRASIEWTHLRRFCRSLPILKLMDIAARWLDRRNGLARSASGPDRPPLTEQEIQTTLDRYRYNLQTARRSAEAHGIRSLFVWQPSPAYGYDLSNHVALRESGGDLLGHERSGAAYAAINVEREVMEDPNFLWLGDLQDGRNKPLYVDTVHYTDDFCRDIAAAIAASLSERDMLKLNSVWRGSSN